MKFIKNKNLWKNFSVIAIMLCIITGLICYSIYLQNQLEKTTAENRSIKTQIEMTKTELEFMKNELAIAKEELITANEKTKSQSEEINSYKNEIEDYKNKIIDYENEIKGYKREIENEEVQWQRRYNEYPVATEAWISMKNLGWSDTVCAGIMGNFMAETGGGSLKLNWDSNGNSGYGLVQWIGGRRSAIKNKYGTYPSVKEQVKFIRDELYGTNGVRKQVTSNQLDAIMNAKTPEECAYAFACYYERCAYEYRSIRKGFAKKAYNYFVC